MNALTTTPSSKPAKTTMPELSPELTALLDSDGSPDAAVRLIVDTVPLLVEARRVLPALQAVAETKAGEEGVKAVIGRRLATYPQPQRSEGEWNAWWADYFDALSDVSLASLEAGMRAYVADPASEFMPKPGRLRELASTTPCRSLSGYYRAKRAVQTATEPPPAEIQRVSPDAVKSMLADYREKSAKPIPPAGSGAYIGGIPDEGGITPEMRELIARRAEDAAR
jgi:hypothetical protein